MSKFDRDRGVLIRKHPEGYRVGMYVDTPGVYFDENAERVDIATAEMAGFDVAEDKKARAKNQLRSNYERQIGAKIAAAEQRIEELLEENPSLLNQLSIIEYENGLYGIEDEDENSIVGGRLSYEEAAVLYAGITGEEWESEGAEDDDEEEVNPYLEMSSKDIRALLKDAEVKVPTGMRMPKLAEFALENLTQEADDDEDTSDLIG